jgi:hypothetical protein
MKHPTAQEFIDLPLNMNRVEIGKWYTERMRELNPIKLYGRTYSYEKAKEALKRLRERN